jgi:inorganic triphosphatase YgiF
MLGLICRRGRWQEQSLQPEIELKLDLSPRDAEKVAQWPLLQGLDSDTAALLATYFDTPDHRLAEEGVSLRIRRSGRRRIQTIKANGRGGAGLFARDEWEMPVSAIVPVLDEDTPVVGVLGSAVADLAPVFEVEVQRRTWIVQQDGATIELVLDRGVVRARGREQAICEIELELKAGPAAALFALARRIDTDIAVRPGVLSKSERGYRLTDVLPSAYKAERVKIDPHADIGTAFRQIAALCLRHYRLNEALLLDGYSVEALHQARVAIRRLRTAFSLFGPVLRKEDVAAFQGELRWLAGIMGEARDLDMLAAKALDAGQGDRLNAAHAVAQELVSNWLASARVRALLIDLVEWLANDAGLGPAAAQPIAPFAKARLGKLRKRIAKRGEHFKKLTDDARHSVRKDAKKLRYASEYFSTVFEGKKVRRRRKMFVARLETMQDVLGSLNDLVTMPVTMARHGLKLEMDEADKSSLLSSAAQAHDAFVDARRFWT